MPFEIGLGWKIILSFREDYFFAFQVAQAVGVVFGFVDILSFGLHHCEQGMPISRLTPTFSAAMSGFF